MKPELQKSLKSVLEQADALTAKVEAEHRAPTDEEKAQLKKFGGEAESLAGQIDDLSKLEAAKRFGEQSDGQAYVPATFSRETLPGEGEFPGLTADAKTGELYALEGAYKGLAEKKLAELKSGAYKDALVQHIRTGNLTVDERKILNRGSEIIMEGKGGERAMKILGEGSDVTGAYWLPPDFRPDLVKKMGPMSTVRPNAKVYTSGSDHITFPAVNYNGSTSDDTYAQIFTSGVRFSWRSSVGSTADFAEATNPIAGQINIPVQLATAAIFLTREQVEDNSFDILGYISDLGAEAFSMGEENAFTNGTGAGQPRGFLQHPSLQNSAASTGILYSTYATVAGTTYWGNLVQSGSTLIAWGTNTTGVIGVEGQLPPQYENNAKWMGTKSTFTQLRSLNVGTGTLPQWGFGSNWPNYTEGMGQQPLLGYPILKNQFMPTPITAHTYLTLGDYSGYFIVDRVGLSVEVFREVYGLRDQVVVYMRKRVGGDLVHYWKVKGLTST